MVGTINPIHIKIGTVNMSLRGPLCFGSHNLNIKVLSASDIHLLKAI